MKIGVIKEIKDFEHRVALSPDGVKLLVKKEYEVFIESNAGEFSYFSNQDYEVAGAKVVSKSEALAAEVILKVNPLTLEELAEVKDGTACISFIYAHLQADLVKAFCKKLLPSPWMQSHGFPEHKKWMPSVPKPILLATNR